jgi:hypothetical protein
MINTGLKGHYAQKGPDRRVITFKRDQPKGPLRPKGTSPRGHYVQKGLLDDKYRPEGPLRLEKTGSNDHYIQKGPDGRPIAFKRDQLKRSLGPKGTGPKGHYVQKGPGR